ncbi:MAG TPA: tRNA (adenosine(37)-N6)-dimethylallyltransferase MiaA [Gemmatimonadales bacterium]|nr:tRNA (adenosine(37)-N6)-dimethylallyltransferase MiaA [Gemmatimonadales bacterium]
MRNTADGRSGGHAIRYPVGGLEESDRPTARPPGLSAIRPLTPVLVGPTAVGKTAVALALSQRLPVTIISADARQVYRRLDIGTAKPLPAERARVPHEGIDLVDPGERFSAGRFAREAAGWLTAARAAGRLPLVVGGTGFYVRALADGLFHEPPLDPERRDQVREWTATLAGTDLSRWALRLDPRFSGGGRQRATRAIEVALLTGRPLSLWQRMARVAGVMRPWYIVLTIPRELLRRRIAERADAMLAAGFVEEVRAELARGTAPTAAGLDGVGYREVVAMLTGQLHTDELRDAIVRSSRQYAKRQETWFRHQLRHRSSVIGSEEAVWTLDATKPPEDLAEAIVVRWQTVQDPMPTTDNR